MLKSLTPIDRDQDKIAYIENPNMIYERLRDLTDGYNNIVNILNDGNFTIEDRYEEILHFIDHFRMYDKDKTVEKTFLCGCCYWFAHILASRFEDGVIVYNPVENHFMTRIDGNIFDINGDVTPWQYRKVVDWNNFDDEAEKRRIVRDCIDFTEEV